MCVCEGGGGRNGGNIVNEVREVRIQEKMGGGGLEEQGWDGVGRRASEF